MMETQTLFEYKSEACRELKSQVHEFIDESYKLMIQREMLVKQFKQLFQQDNIDSDELEYLIRQLATFDQGHRDHIVEMKDEYSNENSSSCTIL
jgi:hypothetical protein